MSAIQIKDDPFVAWDQLRSADPVHWDPDFDAWIISRYADVYPLARNSKALGQGYVKTQYHLLSKNESEEVAKRRVTNESPSLRLSKNFLRFTDAPNHTRHRELTVKALPYKLSKPTNIERFRPQLQKHVDDLIDRIADQHEMDVMKSLAIPLPFRTMATVIANVPVEDFEQFVEPLLLGFFNVLRYPYQMDFWSDDAVERSHQAAIKLEEYFTSLLKERRKNPQNDFMSRLLAVQKEDKTLTDLEIVQMCLETSVCGIHESSIAVLGDGVYLLLSSGQFELLKENPDLASKAVEEVLRFHTPPLL
ncbi:MAG: cytochrome P450 [Xenococcaceae cyanobacterium MO_234.B1]|nr:cytochrome P450 [Xenococcaceae cyanobacterium MO_234.B1]